jgi:DNA-binding MarR family transcriptional regulator
MKHVDLIAPKLDQVIGYHLARASILTTAVFDRAVGQPLALRKVEYTLLALIGDGGATPAGLARALCVAAPSITAWLGKLELRGLVGRQPSTRDRRVQLLALTDEGERVVRTATRRLVDGEAAALQALTRGERLVLVETLTKLAALALEQPAASAPTTVPTHDNAGDTA